MIRILDFIFTIMFWLVDVLIAIPYTAAERAVYRVRGWCYPYCKVILRREATERAGVPVTVMKCANCHRVIEF